MVARWPAFIAAPIVVCAPAAQATQYLSVAQAQALMFPGESLAAFKADHPTWRASNGGWFIVDKVLGKHELITYAVALDAGGRVRGVEILEYLEAHGGEIRDPAWRAQFVGKGTADPLQLDRDIRNISGATLSCRHITDGVKRLLEFHARVLSRN
jgi:hypothetical protein